MGTRTGKCLLCGAPSDPLGIGGKKERCADCWTAVGRARRKRWSVKNIEREAEMKRAYALSEANKSRRRTQWERDPTRNKAWIEANREKVKMYGRRHHLMSTFGLTLEQFDAMVLAQGGRCAICDTENPGSRGWHVDHDHATGIVRDLLCNGCNKGLGMFGDDPGNLLAAERYLQRHRRKLKAVR